jgi:hypothetical protein
VKERDEILFVMTDLSVPFENNGSERDLPALKRQKKISGCFVLLMEHGSIAESEATYRRLTSRTIQFPVL